MERLRQCCTGAQQSVFCSGQPLAANLDATAATSATSSSFSSARGVGGQGQAPGVQQESSSPWNSHWKYLSVLAFARRAPSGDDHMSLSTKWGCVSSAIWACHIPKRPRSNWRESEWALMQGIGQTSSTEKPRLSEEQFPLRRGTPGESQGFPPWRMRTALCAS
jgi:hypothetical protein